MTDVQEEPTPGSGSDGLWRWLVGGLLGGLVILGLLVAAYTIGNNRGQDEARATVPAPTEPAATAPPSTATTAPPTTARRTGSKGCCCWRSTQSWRSRFSTCRSRTADAGPGAPTRFLPPLRSSRTISACTTRWAQAGEARMKSMRMPRFFGNRNCV